MIVEFLLSALKILLRRFQVKRGLFSRSGLFRNRNSLAGIAHFLHGGRGFAARSENDSGEKESLQERFESRCLHVLFCLSKTLQR